VERGVGPHQVVARLPVQLVIRPRSASHPDYRAYAGRVAAGTLLVGDDVAVLPSGQRTTVAAIDTFDGELVEAPVGRSIAVRLRDDVDVSRGDLLAAIEDAPPLRREFGATVCVLAERRLRAGDEYCLLTGTRQVRAVVDAVSDRLDVTTLHRGPTDTLELNDIGDVRLRLSQQVAVDAYADSRGTGAFLLVDEMSGATVAAGMVSGGMVSGAARRSTASGSTSVAAS